MFEVFPFGVEAQLLKGVIVLFAGKEAASVYN